MELFEGSVQLKMLNCLFSLEGMSFLPPPGWIMAEIREMSTMCVKSPAGSEGFRLTIMKVVQFVSWKCLPCICK